MLQNHSNQNKVQTWSDVVKNVEETDTTHQQKLTAKLRRAAYSQSLQNQMREHRKSSDANKLLKNQER